MPEGAVYVGRPSRWGNPFEARYYGLARALALYWDALRGFWNPSHFAADEPDWLVDQAYRAHTGWSRRIGRHPSEQARAELRGHDLACWCPLDQPCHADVLLELAA